MLYSALLGSTVDTCYCQSTSVFLVLSPFTAQCLILSGTCYASVLGWLLEEFYDFLREGVHSALEVDSRAALLWPGAVLGYALDMPVVVHVKVVALPRRDAEAVSMVQTVRQTLDFPVAVHDGRCPCRVGHAGSLFVVAQRPFLMVRPVWQTIQISQLHHAPGGQCS